MGNIESINSFDCIGTDRKDKGDVEQSDAERSEKIERIISDTEKMMSIIEILDNKIDILDECVKMINDKLLQIINEIEDEKKIIQLNHENIIASYRVHKSY